MEQNMTVAPDTGVTLGKILAGIFLAEFNDNGKTAPQLIQMSISKLKKILGPEEAKEYLNSSGKQLEVLVTACIEQAVLGQLTSETKKSFKDLSEGIRITTETLYLTATGQNVLREPRHDKGRWNVSLYKLKGIAERYLDLSPSEIKPEELAKGLKVLALSFCNSLKEHMQKFV